MAESARSADLCTRYDDRVAQADQFRDQDWSNANVDQLRAHVQDFQDRLAQLDAVAEGRLDTAVSTLRANLTSWVRRWPTDAGDQARVTAQPLVEQSLDDVAQAWAVLRSKVEAGVRLTLSSDREKWDGHGHRLHLGSSGGAGRHWPKPGCGRKRPPKGATPRTRL